MPPSLVALFAKKLFGPLASIALILSLAGNVWLGILHWSDGRTITTLTSENTRLASDNGTLKGNNAILKGSVATQNASIDGLKTAADAAAAGARAGQAAAEVVASTYDGKAASIKALPPLPAGADRCAAASALIRATLSGEKTK